MPRSVTIASTRRSRESCGTSATDLERVADADQERRRVAPPRSVPVVVAAAAAQPVAVRGRTRRPARPRRRPARAHCGARPRRLAGRRRRPARRSRPSCATGANSSRSPAQRAGSSGTRPRASAAASKSGRSRELVGQRGVERDAQRRLRPRLGRSAARRRRAAPAPRRRGRPDAPADRPAKRPLGSAIGVRRARLASDSLSGRARLRPLPRARSGRAAAGSSGCATRAPRPPRARDSAR